MIEMYKNQLKIASDIRETKNCNWYFKVNNKSAFKKELEEMRRNVREEIERANQQLKEWANKYLNFSNYNQNKTSLRRKPLKCSRANQYDDILKVFLFNNVLAFFQFLV